VHLSCLISLSERQRPSGTSADRAKGNVEEAAPTELLARPVPRSRRERWLLFDEAVKVDLEDIVSKRKNSSSALLCIKSEIGSRGRFADGGA